ncbi:hypothetical protein HPG69_007260 [Diceros bicornis minor]|uniref:Uncharacterized protein n=1 Tax=Diceros bicornis minor TaxID=77932 RepID=A0A7J7FNE5_DICBM|nr:hypothetical protein HPG69_007260 [Diceros bicornis minor]
MMITPQQGDEIMEPKPLSQGKQFDQRNDMGLYSYMNVCVLKGHVGPEFTEHKVM